MRVLAILGLCGLTAAIKLTDGTDTEETKPADPCEGKWGEDLWRWICNTDNPDGIEFCVNTKVMTCPTEPPSTGEGPETDPAETSEGS